MAVGRHALEILVAPFDLTPLRPAVTDLVNLVGRPTRSLALDVLHQVVGRRDPRHQVEVVTVTQAEAIGEDVFPLEHRHQRARGLYGGKVIVIEVSGAEDVVIREVSISSDRGSYLQSRDRRVVQTSREASVEHPIAGTYIANLLQRELLSDGATTRVDRRGFLRVDIEPLDIGTADSFLLVVGKVEVRVGIDLRREAQVEVREEADALEA